MKPFDLEAAKTGEKILSNGKEIRIVSYNYAYSEYPILGIYTTSAGKDDTQAFTIDDEYRMNGNSIFDLVIAPIKKSM